MSAPRRVWIADDAMRQMRFHGMVCIDPVTDAGLYHHDDVVRELVEALEAIVKKDTRMHGGGMAPDSIGCCGQIARAALAKIAQEDRG